MNPQLRARIIILQVVLVFTFGFLAGFAFWGSSFINGMISDELSTQKIYFPAAGSKALTSLPTSDTEAMQQFAGQQLTTGEQAKVFANSYIAIHLKEVADGKTYSQVSALSLTTPKDTTLSAQVQTLFRGETLRGLLLNAWGWSQVAMYALYAAIGLTAATVVMFCALIFEIASASRIPPIKTQV